MVPELPIEPPEPRYIAPERDEDEVYQEHKDARLERGMEMLNNGARYTDMEVRRARAKVVEIWEGEEDG